MEFLYDAGGVPEAFICDRAIYYYVVNVQGDVVALVDTNGALVVQYTYDAWGNVLSVTGSLADTIGELNPLRYRGYVYDSETGLYYLQSRYYNPRIGRFINADGYVSTGQGVLGNNMFAYCGNSPTIRADITGYFVYSIRTVYELKSIIGNTLLLFRASMAFKIKAFSKDTDSQHLTEDEVCDTGAKQ